MNRDFPVEDFPSRPPVFAPRPLFGRLWEGVIWATVFSLVRSTIAQDPLVLDHASSSFTPPASRSGAVTYAGEPPLSAAPPSDPASGGRPAFIPPPVPPIQREAASTAPPEPQPATIVTQVELPVPPQTAEPLAVATPASRGGSRGDAAFLRNPASRPQEAAPRTAVATSPQPAASSPYREATIPAPPPPGDIPADADSPTVIYSKGQAALPQPATPEAPPPPDIGLMLRQHRYAEVEPFAVEGRDSALASAIGWSYYRDGKVQNAHAWFERAIQWDESNHEATYGLALCLYRMGRYDQAEEVARWRASEYPRMRKILGDIRSNRAVAAFQAKNYRQTHEIFAGIRSYRSLTREEEIMLAWCDFHLGNTARARQEFIRLYRAKADRYSADGIYATYASARDWSGLETLAHERPGPLAALYHEHIGQKYYNQGLYRKAYAESPGQFPELQNIDSPVVGVEIGGRSRSGTGGTSELTEYSARLQGAVFAKGAHRIDAAVGVMELNAGNLTGDTHFGTVPNSNPENTRYTPKTRYSGLFDARIRYEYQDILTPYAELGITPVGGAVNPTFTGKLGLIGTEDWGSWNAEIYRDPVTDSLLSYTGLRDPYTGTTWGRVTETGGRLSLYAQMENDWGFYGSASGGIREGKHVQNNAHVATAFALSKNLRLKGFEYFTVGPALSLEFYDKNLSQFTFGQGGYFSPSYLVQGTAGTRFLTPQGRNSLLRGNAGIGIQTNRQDGTPWFPNDPNGRWHGETSATGVSLSLNVEGLYLLGASWAVGGGLAFNVSPDYNDFSARVTLQYFFEPRRGLYVQDFLTF